MLRTGECRLARIAAFPETSLESKGSRVGGNFFIDAAALEHKPFRFEASIRPSRFDLSDRWTVARPVQAAGTADLLDGEGQRTIRVRGRIQASIAHACDRCLADLRQDFDDSFDLYFYPTETIQGGGEAGIGRDETEVGFYEGDGIGLVDVVREQVLLWLPVRSLCSPDCKGICSVCGANRNRTECDCRNAFVDPRWNALRHLSYKH